MIQCDLQFEILSRRAQMKFREINSTKKHLRRLTFLRSFQFPQRNFIAAQDAVV